MKKNWALVVIVFACLGSFFMSLPNGYAVDDELINASNPFVSQGIDGIADIWSSPMTYYEGKGFEFRPVATTTFAIEYALFGESPQLSHLINLLIYTLACCLLYLMLSMLQWMPKTHWAFWVTLIFAIHPLHNEVVNNLKNRDELLAFVFALTSLGCAIRFLARNHVLWLFMAALSLSLAIFSKVSAVPMVLIIPFLLWFVKKASAQKVMLIFMALFAFGWLRNLWMRLVLGGSLERDYAYYENPLYFSDSLSDFVSTAFASLYFYVKMSVMPYPLVSYYGFNQVPVGDWLSFQTVLGVTLSVSIAGILIIRRKKREAMNLGLCIWLISIMPYTNLLIPAPGVVAERFAFLSVLGFAIFIAHWLTQTLSFRMNWKQLAVLVVCLITMGYNNYRSTQWSSSLSLFEADARKAPNSAKLQFLLAEQYAVQAGQRQGTEAEIFYQQALEGYQKAVRIDPAYTNAHNVMGMLYYDKLNSPQEAIPYFEKALQQRPESASVLYNLASSYRQTGELQKAASYFARSIQQGRSDYLTHAQLSDLLMKLGQYSAVISINQNADFEDNKDRLLTFTGLAQLQLGDTIRGLNNLEKAFLLSPENQFLENAILEVKASQAAQ